MLSDCSEHEVSIFFYQTRNCKAKKWFIISSHCPSPMWLVVQSPHWLEWQSQPCKPLIRDQQVPTGAFIMDPVMLLRGRNVPILFIWFWIFNKPFRGTQSSTMQSFKSYKCFRIHMYLFKNVFNIEILKTRLPAAAMVFRHDSNTSAADLCGLCISEEFF